MASAQRRVPMPGKDEVTAFLHAAQLSDALPSSQAQYCRSLGSLLRYSNLTMDGAWVPTLDVNARMRRDAGSDPASAVDELNLQRPAYEMGDHDGGARITSTAADDDDLDHSPLGDFQSTETWWPALNGSCAFAGRDHGRSPSFQRVVTVSDAKPVSNGASAFPASGYAMESWRIDDANFGDANHVEVAGVDLNASCERAASAVAVVSVAPAAADDPPVLESASRATKGGARRAATKRGNAGSRAPASPRIKGRAGLAVHKSKWNGKRAVSQRESHIWSERQRRKGMNYLFSTLRSLLPHPTSKTDKSTVVGESIKFIQSLQAKLEELTKKQQQMLAARILSGDACKYDVLDTHSKAAALVATGLTLLDHSSDPSTVTALTVLPPTGRDSCLQSFLGSNVGLHVCGVNVFVTTSSPRGRHHGLLHQLLVTIHSHDLDVVNATISTSHDSIFHSLHCQTSQDAEIVDNSLHSALQSVINSFGYKLLADRDQHL